MIFFFGWIESGGSYCKYLQLHPSYPSDKAWKGGWEGRERYDLGPRRKFLMKEGPAKRYVLRRYRELRLECLKAGARVVPLKVSPHQNLSCCH